MFTTLLIGVDLVTIYLRLGWGRFPLLKKFVAGFKQMKIIEVEGTINVGNSGKNGGNSDKSSMKQ